MFKPRGAAAMRDGNVACARARSNSFVVGKRCGCKCSLTMRVQTSPLLVYGIRGGVRIWVSFTTTQTDDHVRCNYRQSNEPQPCKRWSIRNNGCRSEPVLTNETLGPAELDWRVQFSSVQLHTSLLGQSPSHEPAEKLKSQKQQDVRDSRWSEPSIDSSNEAICRNTFGWD